MGRPSEGVSKPACKEFMRTHTELATNRSLLARGRRFVRKPWREKLHAVGFHWVKRVPWVPFPVRLPFGGWWLAADDGVGHHILSADYEAAEWRFVAVFLQPGMTVLDVGAHHGFYSVLASKRVGSTGQVVAFEPSPRERKKLRWHLRLNRCKNVQLERFALGNQAGEAEMFLVEGKETGCNSLRPPQVSEPTRVVSVPLTTLDTYLCQQGIQRVDFLKLDVEGAELSVLKGAMELLLRHPRPVILAEVQDIRTKPWGYPAKEIVRCLCDIGFLWFAPCLEGHLEEIDMEQEKFDGNFIAIPEERVADLREMMSGK